MHFLCVLKIPSFQIQEMLNADYIMSAIEAGFVYIIRFELFDANILVFLDVSVITNGTCAAMCESICR